MRITRAHSARPPFTPNAFCAFAKVSHSHKEQNHCKTDFPTDGLLTSAAKTKFIAIRLLNSGRIPKRSRCEWFTLSVGHTGDQSGLIVRRPVRESQFSGLAGWLALCSMVSWVGGGRVL